MTATPYARLGQLAIGGTSTLVLLVASFAGWINLSPWHLTFEKRGHPAGLLLIYGIVCLFPYLLMTAIIDPGEAVFTTDGEEGVMGSYGTQNAITRRYRRHMISIVFGVIVTAVCVLVSTYVNKA